MGVAPSYKGALNLGFQPTACRLSSARNCLFAVKSRALSLFHPSFPLCLSLCHSPSVGFTFGLAFALILALFPAVLSVPTKAQRIHGTAALLSAFCNSSERASVPRPLRDDTSRVFRTRTWLAHVTNASGMIRPRHLNIFSSQLRRSVRPWFRQRLSFKCDTSLYRSYG